MCEHENLTKHYQIMSDTHDLQLSAQEIEICAWIVEGYTQEEIGVFCDVSHQAISKKISKIRKKLSTLVAK